MTELATSPGAVRGTSRDADGALRLKLRLLREGINVHESVYDSGPQYKRRVEAIYGHHTRQPPRRPIPQEIILNRPLGLARGEAIVCQVRYNTASPHVLRWDGRPILDVDGTAVDVEFIDEPEFYTTTLESDPVPARSVAQLLGTDLLGIVPSNYCALFSTKEECTFCEIIPHYSLVREYKRSIKPDEVQIEALDLGLRHTSVTSLLFTTGNYDLTNERTLNRYVAVRSRLHVPDRVTRSYACLMPPDDRGALTSLHNAGFTSVLFDIEVWNPDHFPALVPGKARWLGHDGFLRMLDGAVERFGTGEVYSNLVYGIQSLDGVADGSRFDGRRETDRCIEATVGLLDRGVIPLFTVFHTTGHGRIGQVRLDGEQLERFAFEYGRLVHESGLVPTERNAAIFGLGSIANHFYNDAYFAAKTRMGCV